ncbi:hypothetical protein [Aquabacterium sp. NJ1]|uniref:hypothetical protein n=1 Tax=Aquabacterium sp. NJ1 TaxID=1538295 RepID=UPI00068A2E0D|nr:hypothetical protein [Aquabacterium sp. NJ1]
MTSAEVLAGVRDALQSITAPRLFETERGYQGALLGQLDRRLQLPARVIVEQEYQKQAGRHGLTIRPDIIIHEPFDPERFADRTQGNVAVIELKLRSTAAEAADDFMSLGLMLDVLRYPLGIFINIGAERTWAELLPQALHGRVACFAVRLQDTAVTVVEAYR